MTQGLELDRSEVRGSLGRFALGDTASPSSLSFFRRPLAPILTVVAVAILVVVAVTFGRMSGQIAVLWGAGGLSVAVWLRGGRGLSFDAGFGALIFCGFLAGELLLGHTPVAALSFTLFNLIEIVLAVLLARQFLPGLNVRTVQGVARLTGISLVSTLAAAIVVTIFGILLPDIEMTGAFLRWWSGHAMGMALIGTFGLSLDRRWVKNLLRPLRLIEGIVLLSLILGVCYLIFGHFRLPYSFVLMPFFVLMAVRFRVVGTALALTLVLAVAMTGTMLGNGPYRQFGPEISVLIVNLLVLFGYTPLLLVAALLEERDRFHEVARRGQERAERASAAKSRLLANVAHEIKSPVSGIIGIGELWAAGQLGQVSPTQLEMAEMLVKTARQTEALAHDLLDVARAESGAIRVDLRPTDVTGVMEDVRRTMLLRLETARVPVEVVVEGDALVASADSHRLSQVIGNLVNNAIKYGGQGGPVAMHALWADGRVRIEVRDKGPGLSVEQQAQLFEPFNRLGLERSSIEGHGIGLALAKRLTELQGGEIGVISQPGNGATFWIELLPA